MARCCNFLLEKLNFSIRQDFEEFSRKKRKELVVIGLFKRKRKQRSEKQLFIDEFDPVRNALEGIKDIPLRAVVLGKIACVSTRKEDLERVHEVIATLVDPFRSEALVIMAKNSARAGNFVQAREFALVIKSEDRYQRALAFTAVYHYSRDKRDFDMAFSFSESLHFVQKKDVRMRLEAEDSYHQEDVLRRLVHESLRLNGHKDSHILASFIVDTHRLEKK